MNAIILNGGPGNGRGAACQKIKDATLKEFQSRGWAVRAFDLDGMSIKPCLGCFACWLKHPGTCAIKDDEEEILKALAVEDVAIWITPVTFGGYSPALKKALDRSIPTILPYFIRVHGEIHHPQRYPRQRKLVVIGTLGKPDEEAERIFHGLVLRNALNKQSVKTGSCVVDENAGDAEVAARVKDLFRAVEIA